MCWGEREEGMGRTGLSVSILTSFSAVCVPTEASLESVPLCITVWSVMRGMCAASGGKEEGRERGKERGREVGRGMEREVMGKGMELEVGSKEEDVESDVGRSGLAVTCVPGSLMGVVTIGMLERAAAKDWKVMGKRPAEREGCPRPGLREEVEAVVDIVKGEETEDKEEEEMVEGGAMEVVIALTPCLAPCPGVLGPRGGDWRVESRVVEDILSTAAS